MSVTGPTGPADTGAADPTDVSTVAGEVAAVKVIFARASLRAP